MNHSSSSSSSNNNNNNYYNNNNNMLIDEQFGFSTNSSTVTATFNLMNVLEHPTYHKQPFQGPSGQ
jgi:hypothetical protein